MKYLFLDDPRIPHLIQSATTDKSAAVRRQSLQHLQKLPWRQPQHWRDELKPWEKERLADADPLFREVTDAILPLLEGDPDGTVRTEAFGFLQRRLPEDELHPLAKERLYHPLKGMRILAIEAYAWLRPCPELAAELQPLLQDEDPRIVSEVLETLEWFGVHAKALKADVEALDMDDTGVWLMADNALDAIDGIIR
ncbi:MAG: hypothetical protein AAF517_21085 [Planctomycetota bacterium]